MAAERDSNQPRGSRCAWPPASALLQRPPLPSAPSRCWSSPPSAPHPAPAPLLLLQQQRRKQLVSPRRCLPSPQRRRRQCCQPAAGMLSSTVPQPARWLRGARGAEAQARHGPGAPRGGPPLHLRRRPRRRRVVRPQLPSPPPPPPFPGAPPDLASSPPAGRFGMLSEWSQLPKKQFRTLHPAACWKKQAPIPDTPAVRSLRNTHWEVYLQWGSRFAALPFCPPQPVLPWRGRPTSSPDARLPVVDVCATLAANEHPFVLEWTAHHLLLGVRRLNIYPVNREQRAVLERTLGDYARPGGPVWVHPTESDLSQEWIATGGRHVSIERRNIAHCFRERLAGSDIVLHIDLDEYVFPGVYPDVPSLFAAELAAHPKDEVAFCVRYLGYGPDPPTERFPNGTMYLSQLTHSGTFCSNSKTGGVSDCVKKPKVKVRRHFVHELPLKAGCRSDGDMIGALLKKVAPKPCCRATYFVAHLQQRDFWFDSVVRRRRELSDKGAREAALSGFRQWHGAAYLSDTRMRAYGAAAEAALRKGCWRAGWQGPCPVPLPPMQPPV
eukprot:TRINITY_DN3221_c1_g1_i2.p1 TRINITY_DN3221_c1_g1~~TRINITY_DN3221_c1_g1_i2.p1  ORF type:complete len:552 (+),score=114.95 TRINITY_DN3221_c1_g1_i2:84-1739(+)